MIKKTLSMHMLQILQWTFPHCRKASDHQEREERIFTMAGLHHGKSKQSQGSQWELVPTTIAEFPCLEQGAFHGFHGLNGFCNEPQNANLTAHLYPAETAKQNKKWPRLFFKVWIKKKVQAVSSGLLYLQANENWLLAKLFLIFYT